MKSGIEDNIRYTPKRSTIIYTIGLILVMYKSNRILYARFLPDTIIFLSEILILIIFTRYNYERLRNISLFKFLSILGISSVWIYDCLWVNTFDWYNILVTIITILYAFILISIDTNQRNWILKQFNAVTTWIVGLAIIGWLLFLCKVPLPSFTNMPDAYYIHTIYPFFNLNGYPEAQLLPRFAGPFLEPGHLGTMCVFMLYVNKLSLKRLSNIILLLGVILSLSLAAYGLLVGAVLLYLYQNKKYISLLFIGGCFGIIGIGAIFYNNGDNPINQAIVMRLEMDENGEIEGNNRTTGAFDRAYDLYLNSDKMLFGVGVEAYGKRNDQLDNILLGCATYKRYFYTRGILGSILIILFLLMYYWHYRSKHGLCFLIIYIVANCIRDYPGMPMWIYYYIMAIPYLKLSEKSNKL